MSGMSQLCKPSNFSLAWRWIRSNADSNYKSHFRKLYGIYAIADEELLELLRTNVASGKYEPQSSSKIFMPKASGILRPYSLLCIEDQIVYQACANVIAEKLSPKVRKRYYQEVFGHLYAGKTSKWFYRKWSDGYKAFNDKAREAFNNGFVYSASFDLTACYDSIDHGVLKHFLLNIGCELEFVNNFIGWLSKWTATESGYFHNHGIPQGPLSSGLISEVVLKYFDEKREKTPKIKYLRYVDDIKLFAKTESELRRSLVRLDLLSKDFINAANGRVTGKSTFDAIKIVRYKWKPTVNHPDLQAAAATWLIAHDSFSYKSCQTAAFKTKSWWAKAIITTVMVDNVIGKPSLEEIANKQIRSTSVEVSLAGAYLIYNFDLKAFSPYKDINPIAGKVLRRVCSKNVTH